MIRFLTAGESHGRALVALVEGVPAHVALTTEDVARALARRRLGYGRGARMAFEADEVELLAGVRHGETLGSPVAIRVGNSEWPKWQQVMAADPVDADVLESLARNAPLTRPRPGHADLAGMQKYDWDEARPVLERASARETAARVAAGAVAKALLRQAAGVEVLSHVVAIGGVTSGSESAGGAARQPRTDGDVAGGSGGSVGEPRVPVPADLGAIDADPVRCFDPVVSAAIQTRIEQAKSDGDTLGGVVEVLAYGLPPGLGSHTQWDRRLDARLAGALMSIQAIKGVGVGDGFATADRPGSQAHDEIVPDGGHPARLTDRAGGVEGGISNGGVLRLRAAMKPIATVPRALRTIDTATGEPASAHHQRSDVCAVAAAGVVAEAMVALVLADAVMEKTGGDSLAEVRRNLGAYVDRLQQRGLI